MRSSVAIVGIGYTRFSRDREKVRTVEALAVEACRSAIEDAGLQPSQIDAVLSYQMNDAPVSRDVARSIGLGNLNWWGDTIAGGSYTGAIVGQAALLIGAGVASRVVCFRALNGYSGRRFGRGERGTQDASGISQFTKPYGMVTPAEVFGMPARRHMHRYGTTKQQLGAVAVTLREHAVRNERAVRRQPLTMDEYLAARVIADPYSLYDCCQETDGACAVVVCRSEEAADLPHRPVHLLGSVLGAGAGPRLPFDGWDDMDESHFSTLAKALYDRTGLRPTDVDVALLYDAFTFEVIKQLEDFGFCDKGEGGPYVESGAIALDGSTPVNPHGGLLSEAYVHGFNHIVEAVIQLRGDAGIRQVPNANTALVTGFAFSNGSAMLLASEATT